MRELVLPHKYPEISYPPHWLADASPERIRAQADDVLRCTAAESRLRPLTGAEWFAWGLRASGKDVPGTAREVIRSGLSTAQVAVAFTGQINQFFFDSFRSVVNTLDGVLRQQSIGNFLPAIAVSQFASGRLEPQGRGPASQFFFGLKGESWGLARYSTQWAISEEDLINSPSVDLASVATAEVGRAAARVLPDLAYSLLLSNPKMVSDGLPLFDAGHNNYGTGGSSALQSAGVDTPDALDAGLSAIGRQVLTDEQERAIHVGLSPQYLIASPAAYGPARRLARRLQLADGQDLTVRMESRLSSIGTVDPQSGNVYAASDGAWLLTSPGEQAASIIAGGLEGQGLEPILHTYMLSGPGEFAGTWGIGCDCKLDLGVVVVDHKPLYFSSGS